MKRRLTLLLVGAALLAALLGYGFEGVSSWPDGY
jgi:hypothetical protein